MAFQAFKIKLLVTLEKTTDTHSSLIKRACKPNPCLMQMTLTVSPNMKMASIYIMSIPKSFLKSYDIFPLCHLFQL